MGLTIAIIVVLFFLGRKLNHRGWLQATCFAGMLIAAIMLFSYYLFMPWIIGFVCACVLTLLLMFLAVRTASAASNRVDEEDIKRFTELVRFVRLHKKSHCWHVEITE